MHNEQDDYLIPALPLPANRRVFFPSSPEAVRLRAERRDKKKEEDGGNEGPV